MYIHEDMETFTMTSDEIYALKKEMKHKDKIIDDMIESMGKMADKYKRLLFEKDIKIEELNDELSSYEEGCVIRRNREFALLKICFNAWKSIIQINKTEEEEEQEEQEQEEQEQDEECVD